MNESFHRKCGLADWYVRRAFLCCLFARIVNVTLWGLSSFPYVSNESNLTSRHHRKSSSVFWPFILRTNSHYIGSESIVWTITSLFLSGRFFPMENSSPHFLLKTQSFYGQTLNGTHKKLNQPFSHRSPVNLPGHWHWNVPGTLIHVPPLWHGLSFLLAHSSMSEKTTQWY